MRKTYLNPAVKELTVSIEKGFAVSLTFGEDGAAGSQVGTNDSYESQDF